MLMFSKTVSEIYSAKLILKTALNSDFMWYIALQSWICVSHRCPAGNRKVPATYITHVLYVYPANLCILFNVQSITILVFQSLRTLY